MAEEGVGEDARRDVADGGEVGDRAPELDVQEGGDVPALEVEVDQRGGPPGGLCGERELYGRERRADAPLAPLTVTTVPPEPPGASPPWPRWRRTSVDHWATACTRPASSSYDSGSATRPRAPESMAAANRPGLASVVTRMTPTAGKRRAISRISSNAGAGPMRSWTTSTSGSSSTASAASRARASTSWVESVTGGCGSASGSWLSRVTRERTASGSAPAGRILVGMRAASHLSVASS